MKTIKEIVINGYEIILLEDDNLFICKLLINQNEVISRAFGELNDGNEYFQLLKTDIERGLI